MPEVEQERQEFEGSMELDLLTVGALKACLLLDFGKAELMEFRFWEYF